MKNKYIDLHTHSVFSDGTNTPKEIVEIGLESGLSAIALTDHDTIDGISYAIESGIELGMEVIPGIELSGFYRDSYMDREIHIVGLFIDSSNADLNEFLVDIRTKRKKRNIKMLSILNKFKFLITYDELKKFAKRDLISRVHYAKVMVEKGYVKNTDEAFSKYIGDGKPAHIKKDLPDAKVCIDIINNAGGVAVLAHPTLYGMSYFDIYTMAKKLQNYKLKGIETLYSTHSKKQQHEIEAIANQLGLCPSGGSDYHGSNKPNISLGTGKGNLNIPYKYLTRLKNA